MKTSKEIKINHESKIIWKNHPIARLKKGNDYLNPDIDIIADESLNEDSKLKLVKFLNSWLSEYINEILGDLIKLTKYKINNQYQEEHYRKQQQQNRRARPRIVEQAGE